MLAGLALGTLLAIAVWGFLRRPSPSQKLPIAGQRFPLGFLWGAAEDAFQHEGGNTQNDWHAWIHQSPSPIDRGATYALGTNFWQRWREDFQRAKDDGHTAHRFGLEWSRLEPAPGRYDEAAWAQYERMVRACKEEMGFVTFVNLWHYTLPLWASRAGGWENPTTLERFEAMVAEAARRLGPWVDRWSTMIDAQLYPLAGYLAGQIPPHQKSLRRARAMFATMLAVHARAYRVLHALDVKDFNGAPKRSSVGQIYFFTALTPRGLLLDRLVCRHLDHLFNWALLDALVLGKSDIAMVPWLDAGKRPALEPATTLDWLGVNYFTRRVVEVVPGRSPLDFERRQVRWPVSDMNWEIFPQGIYELLIRISMRHPGLPLYITENGLADERDDRRPEFIVDHLAFAHKAIEQGAALQGYFHWSLTDNWEWALGSWPRFGLYRVDAESGDRVRTASAELFAEIARSNRLPDQRRR
ncbi:MAG: glycoside hydrolase family 1 protein [Deltaproteobacteria bacterium]|nr:glycoside hydrolase family 1 protein [Deltaproteobacteria bacterium]